MPKLKLTDTDRVILASAGAREGGLVLPVPKSLKLSAADREPILRSLLKKGLLGERPSLHDEQPWIKSEDGTRNSLIIVQAGLEAVGLGDAGEEPHEAIASTSSRRTGKASTNGGKRSASKPKGKPRTAPTEPAVEGRTTKLDMLIAALRQRKGATVEELMEATGWQAHSVRGAISGALKKRMSLNVTSNKTDGRGRVYRIEAAATK